MTTSPTSALEPWPAPVRDHIPVHVTVPALEPEVPEIPYEDQDAHSRRLYEASHYTRFDIGHRRDADAGR